VQIIKDRHDISHSRGQPICVGIMRFIAPAMPTSIDKHELIVMPQGIDIAVHVPPFEAVCESMVKHKRRSLAVHFVVDTHTAVPGIRHSVLLRPGLESLSAAGRVGRARLLDDLIGTQQQRLRRQRGVEQERD